MITKKVDIPFLISTVLIAKKRVTFRLDKIWYD